MVTRILYLLFILLPLSLFSAKFTASVTDKEITLGKSFTLTLKLADASAKGNLDISSLRESFIIRGQQQSSKTVINNGHLSFDTSWQLTLIAQKEGVLTIPSISLNTSAGTFLSDAIQINVVKEAADSSSENDSGITLTATISKAKPYKNEPITHTIKLVSKHDLANVVIPKLNIKDAIVEMINEPIVEEKVIDGISCRIIEFHHLITPLKAAPLVIPPTVIQGGILPKNRFHIRSFFDENLNHLQMMRNFNRMEPFAMSTDVTIVDVQPPMPGVTPWLPAVSLKIEEKWEEFQALKVGEPVTRSFHIVAEGVKASQLPSLADLQLNHDTFKIYADKPEMKDVVEGESVRSYRDERYTLIPQEVGPLSLPEITITWWDVSKEEIAYARVPSRILEVFPAPAPAPAPTMNQTNAFSPTVDTMSASTDSRSSDPLLYVLIAGLGVLLLFAFFWARTLQRKISQLTVGSPLKNAVKKSKNPLPSHLQELETISTPEELKRFLQLYAQKKWSLPQNAPLNIVLGAAKQRSPEHFQHEIFAIKKSLEDALYRDKNIDVDDLVKRCSVVLNQTKKTELTADKKEKLPDLNPT